MHLFKHHFKQFAPVRKKYLRANDSKFVNKELSKTMMERKKLYNKFFKQKKQKLDWFITNKKIYL